MISPNDRKDFADPNQANYCKSEDFVASVKLVQEEHHSHLKEQ